MKKPKGYKIFDEDKDRPFRDLLRSFLIDWIKQGFSQDKQLTLDHLDFYCESFIEQWRPEIGHAIDHYKGEKNKEFDEDAWEVFTMYIEQTIDFLDSLEPDFEISTLKDQLGSILRHDNEEWRDEVQYQENISHDIKKGL